MLLPTNVGLSRKDHAMNTIAAALIDPGPNDRTRFAEKPLADLAASIAALGLAQPITVRPVGDRFQIVCGERRFRATQLLGWTEVPAIVKAYDDEEASKVMLAENVQRADLDPIEEAAAYQARMLRFGLTARELGEWAQVTTDKVNMRLQLLDLVPEVQHLVATQQVTTGFALCMVKLDPNRQRMALRAYLDGGLDWFELDALCKRLAAEQAEDPDPAMFDPDDFLQVQEWVAAAKEAKRTTRTELLDALAALVDAVDGLEHPAAATARRLVAREQVAA